ncbi:MAG: hypothetical protein KatS3mg126_2422 [Lysobacteraceae bacterium]|nr:MAG: hypothetical protein KatS3mg126_2422 [Xanthomonadaceae bacterium]
MDAQRALFLVAYDIADPRRLARVGRCLAGYRVAGQKSLIEIWVTPAELAALRTRLDSLIDPQEDRVHGFGLDPRMKPWLFGRATHFEQPWFAIV